VLVQVSLRGNHGHGHAEIPSHEAGAPVKGRVGADLLALVSSVPPVTEGRKTVPNFKKNFEAVRPVVNPSIRDEGPSNLPPPPAQDYSRYFHGKTEMDELIKAWQRICEDGYEFCKIKLDLHFYLSLYYYLNSWI